jgi:DNA modification methylase
MTRIEQGDAATVLRTLPEASVNCIVTSPPYWGLRDYGVQGQIGLERVPEEYVANLVAVFREIKRVLRDDGTCWINLGPTYTACVLRDNSANRSPLLWRALSCGTDGKARQDFQGDGRACLGYDDGCQGASLSRHADTVHNDRSVLQGEPQTSRISRDSGHSDYDQASPDASLRGVQVSTMLQSFDRPLDASCPEATASASRPEPQTFLPASHLCADTSGGTPGNPSMSPPLVVRTSGKESFFSACGSPDCHGIGRCGLCWCRLAIPSLNVKAKDQVSIPHLVALALQADGWYLRLDNIWHKLNAMCESVKDRPTRVHEYVFLMSKSERYFYDQEAVREPQAESSRARAQYGWRGRTDDGSGGARTGSGFRRCATEGLTTGEAGFFPADGLRNMRSVWTVAVARSKDGHFATFPPALVRPMILAGCPVGGTVLDPFAGSGTVGEVAEEEGRNSVLIELRPEYVDMIKARTRQAGLFCGEERG